MKVLVAHNRYRSDVPSGENRVVETEIDHLQAAGVQVIPYVRSSDEIDTMPISQRLTIPLQPLHGRRALDDIDRLIRQHQPDVLHLHNPFPLISWSVVRVAHRRGVPVVQTVHNHRHSCMRGSFFRDGHACQLCRGRATPWPAVQHGCYRDSHLQSIPMAMAFRLHRQDQRSVDRYICLTQPIADSLLASGLVTPDQVAVRANSVPDPGAPTAARGGLAFIGRLTPEKGLPLLLEAWRRAESPLGELTIVGDGALRPEVEKVAADPAARVTYRGPLDAEGVADTLRRTAAVAVPSRSPEAMPLVVLEAFAHGRAVLATEGGGLDAVVDPTVGLLCPGTVDGLAGGLARLASSDLPALGRAARRRYAERHSPQVVTAAQLEIYRTVIAESSR